MLKKLIILSILYTLSPAQILISPIDAMQNTYSKSAKIQKRNVILTKEKANKVQKKAKAKLKSKIFKYFIAKQEGEILGYGILVSRKVRSNNAVTMYLIDTQGIIKSIEVIAFNEPLEFMASEKWISQFDNTPSEKKLKVGRDIVTITGATLTAQSLVDASRIASAFYEVILKDK